MILFKLRDYLQQRKTASLQDLAQHVQSDPEVVRSMLEQWIRKGRVYRIATTGSQCGNCTHCNPLTFELYSWQQEGITTPVTTVLAAPTCQRN
jgi:predicted metal-binding protein